MAVKCKLHTSSRTVTHVFETSTKKVLELLWFCYSTPTPQNARQILSLLLLCFAITISTTGLLFHWLNGLLMYHSKTAGIAAVIYAVAVFLLLFLVHPVRCAFTLMFPTLGTRQGRKLILSLCVMTVLIYILPNIATNIAELTQLMKCTSENLAHSLLNSSQLSNSIKRNIVDKVKQIKDLTSPLMEQLSVFDHSTDINVHGLRERLKNLSRHVGEDFFKAKLQLDELKLISRRILAAVLVVYLFVDSSIYLKSYLTSMKFDNIYITGMLKSTASPKGIHIETKDLKDGVNSTSFKMTKKELLGCLSPVLLITMYLLMTTMLIILDYIVHYAVASGGPWLLDIPQTVISMNIHFKVDYLLLDKVTYTVNLNRRYSAIISSDVTQCKTKPSTPSVGVLFSLILLYLLSYFLAFLEVYARRLRRKVAASFFQQQEEKRIKFLFEKILNKKKRHVKHQAVRDQ
ncbi:osteoclast stimulatory transmembrane protein [Trichomycterus rosablanca]|uniref:osteoclast stimulatory transmembrane protein n=1 Tax=Trichomycterus rosablanca TaxID=2290929 RepID=UPI002F35B5FB